MAKQRIEKPLYVYSEETDTYVTNVPGVPKPIRFPGSVHRALIAAYSNFDGAPATINEIAREFAMDRTWVTGYLRAHGITHDSEPFSREELASKDEDELVGDMLQKKRARVREKASRRVWAAIEEDAQKWRSFEDHVLMAIKSSMGNHKATIPKPMKPRAAPEPYEAVVGLFDFHYGKYGAPSTRDPYNREIADRRLRETTERALADLLVHGTPERLYVPTGNDFLHFANDHGKTVSMRHDQDLDGKPFEIVIQACQLLETWAAGLAAVAPVEFVFVEGNHDGIVGILLHMYLAAAFRDTDRVIVSLDHEPRAYRRFGTNLIGFTHGRDVRNTSDLAGLMSVEAAEHWEACVHRTVYTGDLHTEKSEIDTSYGVTRRQLPCLSGSDKWSADRGYQHAPRALQIYRHGVRSGLLGMNNTAVIG